MELIEVVTRRDEKRFLQLPIDLYRDSPFWIQPLNRDVQSVFDPKKNKFYQQGECARWILVDEGTVVGRVAAFINRKTIMKGNDQPTGGMGFFECIEDKAAAFQLFAQCKTWLQSKGMEAMDGPINFGGRDRWWGLLVDGFGVEPNYQCNYNFPYYQEFFEAYGFQVYFKQFTFSRQVDEPLSPRLKEKADMIAADPDYSFRHLRKDELSKLPEYIRTIYNKAWTNRAETPELSRQQAELLVKQMKPIMDLKLLYLGFYKGEAIACFLSLPEINQIFKYLHGRLDLIGKLKFLWHTFRKTNRKAFGVLFGIVPEHQGTGADGALIMAASKIVQVKYQRYDVYEMNWIGDFNPKMLNVVRQVGGNIAKTHITYRKLFDESKPFKRHPFLR
jgi:hypothetical protein